MNIHRGTVRLAALLLGFFSASANSALSASAPEPTVPSDLSAEELAAPQAVHFAVKLRNFDELLRRVAKGDVLSREEYLRRHCPDPEAWRAVAAWARALGWAVEAEDVTHLTVFATATVGQVQDHLHARFAHAGNSRASGAAAVVSAPVVPAEIAPLVQSVWLRDNRSAKRKAQTTAPVTIPSGSYASLGPQAVARIYNASGVSVMGQTLDGTGQTVVILGADAVNGADLTAFWTKCGLPTTLSQFTEYDPYPQSLGPNTNASEWTKDIEWASAMAPKARLLYISTTDPDKVLQLLMTQFGGDATIHQISESTALSEGAYQQAGSTPFGTSYYASIAALGITFFASSGDHGSNAGFVNGISTGAFGYVPGGVLAPDYPASDPYVTGVGGTALGYVQYSDSGFALPGTEGGWCLPDPPIVPSPGEPANYNYSASTGGISLFFQRPAWQTGSALLKGANRCVPDVAAFAYVGPPAYAYFNAGAETSFAGTSMSSPIWAGLCALLNQGRAITGLTSLGLLGPHVYPLLGSTAFNSITVGSSNAAIEESVTSSSSVIVYNGFTTTANNGAYGVGAGYNLVTGLGSPNIGILVGALAQPVAPSITAQPIPQSVPAGTPATFSVQASGTVVITYQWYFNGQAIAGATGNGYSIASAQAANAGTYTVKVTNPAGSVTSNPAALTVTVLPVITIQPVPQSAVLGSSATFTVAASGPGTVTYQWYKNGAAIAGATGTTVTLGNVQRSDNGDLISVVVANASGSVTSVSASLTVAASHLGNISTRAYVGTGSQVLIVGYVVGGAGATQSLIRGVGPALTTFNVTGVLATPRLDLFDGVADALMATDIAWGNAPTKGASTVQFTVQSATSALFAQAGAFALPTGSADCAFAATVPVGAYSAQVSGVGATTGVALAELYDLDTGTPTARFTNISSRAYVGASTQPMIAGFVVTGSVPETVLIRGIGPGLGRFGVAGVLSTPQLVLYDKSAVAIATNTGWNNAVLVGSSTVSATAQAATAAVFSQAGAFSLTSGSADCAMVAVLPPGTYTAQVFGLNGATGVGLVEVYELQ